jgi:hypothetical protein
VGQENIALGYVDANMLRLKKTNIISGRAAFLKEFGIAARLSRIDLKRLNLVSDAGLRITCRAIIRNPMPITRNYEQTWIILRYFVRDVMQMSTQDCAA